MPREPATQAERLRVAKGRPAETPILDLAAGVRVYLGLLIQSRQLEGVMDELRGRILDAMERLGIEQFDTDGIHASRQVRRFPPELDETRARRILARERRLGEVERTVLDPEKALQVLNELFLEGKLRREELPYAEPRTVDALIVRSAEEERY